MSLRQWMHNEGLESKSRIPHRSTSEFYKAALIGGSDRESENQLFTERLTKLTV